MPQDRFYLNTPFAVNQQVVLDTSEEIHHFRVMRIRPNEMIEIVNGCNQLGKARVVAIHKNSIDLLIQSVEEVSCSKFSVILCQAICRQNRLDTIVEKVTELGVTEIWLFPGELSDKKELSSTQQTRLQHLAISAMKQSGRLDLPKIKYKTFLSHWTKDELPLPAFFGSVEATAPSLAKNDEAMIFIGPESGFSAKEIAHFSTLGIVGVKLNGNILRTDTAAIAALSILQNWRDYPSSIG